VDVKAISLNNGILTYMLINGGTHPGKLYISNFFL
jgi:hypothetical protein